MKEPHSDVLGRVVYDLASSINSPRSLAVWLCFKHDQSELLQLGQTDPATNDTRGFALDYFITEYLSKYKGLKTNVDLDAVALEKWLASEEACRITNSNFRDRAFGVNTSPRAEALLFRAQRQICKILGRVENVTDALSRWSNGATYDIRKKDAAPDNKMIRPISVTGRASKYLAKVLNSDPHWMEALSGYHPDGPYCAIPSTMKIVRGAKYETVPKSAKTNRVIASEPTGNAFLQQAVHNYMRSRLKRYGVDLSNQERNQSAARRAYKDLLATIDLSSASDTVSQELVWQLLPVQWVWLLDDLRSPEIELSKDNWVKVEKFSSMGNAFTFELESLIFYALACAVAGEDSTVEVYGDDIIVEQQYAAEVINLLVYCGFSVNTKKSYVSGNFFESCGEHFHRGTRVTPPYQKEELLSSHERVRAHNRLYRFGQAQPEGPFKRRIRKLCKWMVSNHPDRQLPMIPEGVEGDDGYLVDPLRLISSYDKNHGFRCQVLTFSLRMSKARSESALYAYKLRHFGFQNTDPKGRCGSVVAKRGHWVYKTRWIPEADTNL